MVTHTTEFYTYRNTLSLPAAFPTFRIRHAPGSCPPPRRHPLPAFVRRCHHCRRPGQPFSRLREKVPGGRMRAREHSEALLLILLLAEESKCGPLRSRPHPAPGLTSHPAQIGRASCRERVC